MKFIHLADLHLGKKVNGFSMEMEQESILKQVLTTIENSQKTDDPITHVIIAGDVYDRNVPTITAVTMFDEFVTQLASLKVTVYIIAGNHDSGERLAFGSRLFALNNIHVVTSYDGVVACDHVMDAFGEVNVYSIPYVRPVDVRHSTGVEVNTFQEAFQVILDRESIDTQKRNLLIAHQNINGAATCDSEDIYIGGLDGISADLISCFDYAALGHLHQNQKVRYDHVCYAGSPVKYSFSEAGHTKAMNVVTLKEKGNITIEKVPFVPIHETRIIKGRYAEIMQGKYDAGKSTEDYVQVILEDDTEIVDVIRKLRDRYPNIMHMKYDNSRTQSMHSIQEIRITEEKTPMKYIDEFYQYTNDHAMSAEQKQIMTKVIDEIWGKAK